MSWFVENKERVLEHLRSREATTIEFVKVDGTNRTMLATLNQQTIAEVEGDAAPTTQVPKHDDSDLIAVYDIEAEGFRSFYIQNLYYVEGIDTEA